MVFKIYLSLVFLMSFVFNIVWCNAGLPERMDAFEEADFNNVGNAPFFELPCMVVGGTCARSVACPPGTKVGTKGLCPVQQEFGMECCRPTKVEIKCRSRGGECVSGYYKCPRPLKVKEATDCEKDQTCCSFIK